MGLPEFGSVEFPNTGIRRCHLQVIATASGQTKGGPTSSNGCYNCKSKRQSKCKFLFIQGKAGKVHTKGIV